MKHFTARSKPRGCFDLSLVNHINTPNKPLSFGKFAVDIPPSGCYHNPRRWRKWAIYRQA